MWLFTRYGFFSVTRPTFGLTRSEAASRVQVRARVKSHLQALTARFEPLAHAEVIESNDSDYRYRLVVDRKAWAQVAQQLAEDVDYSNFKSKCARKNPWTDAAYVSALHDVWRIHYRLQSKGGGGDKP